MPIILPAGFNVTSTEPVDARFSVANATARLGLSVANVYEGLIVYQRDNDTIYVLVNAAQPSLEVSWQIIGANVSGSLFVTGSITSLGGFTGSLFGTASWAINALTASFTPNALVTASVNLNTITFTKGDGSTFPITVNTGSAGGGSGAGFPFSGSAVITGSLIVTGSVTATQGYSGSLFGTSSWSINALTSSTSTSASYAVTASVAQSGTGSFTGSFFGVFSGSLFGTSSWSISALTASNTPNALITASISLNTITFTKGDGSTFPITVNTGSGGGGGGGGGTTTNSLFFNASGSGSAPGTSFDGSVAFTASYNTVGANKVITSGPTAPTGGLDGDYYFQYDVSNTLFFYTTRKTGSYTLAGIDIGRLVEIDSGSANTLTIPTNASVAIPLYSRFTVTQYGAGQTSFASGSGVTVRSRSNFTKISARYGFANLVKIGTDEWYLYGDISS
jgi:hypothetical protein